MTIDALGYERQFIDHLAPVWRRLPDSIRGDFYVEPSLVEYAAGKIAHPIARARLNINRGRMVPPAPRGRPALVASYGDTKEARRFGYGPLVYLEHGIGQSYGTNSDAAGSYSGGKDRDDTDLFLVPGPDPAARWRAAYPAARVEIVGSPHLDDLPRREASDDPTPVVAVSFHWPASLTISGYAGTAIGDYAPVLADVSRRWTTIGHAHPKGDWPERARRTFDRAGIPFVDSFDEVCRRADIYVCDNSSTIYEFAAMGRPVVLLNARHWHRNGPELGLRFWAASGVGVQVDDPAYLIRAIDYALEDDLVMQRARDDNLAKVYQPRSGGAQLAADAIADWLETRGRVAA